MESNISRVCRTTSQTFLHSLWCNIYMTSHHVGRQPSAAHNLPVIATHNSGWYPHNISINLVYKYFYSCNCYKTVDTKCSEWWIAHLYVVCLTHESLRNIGFVDGSLKELYKYALSSFFTWINIQWRFGGHYFVWSKVNHCWKFVYCHVVKIIVIHFKTGEYKFLL